MAQSRQLKCVEAYTYSLGRGYAAEEINCLGTSQLLWTRAEARCTGRGGTAGTMAPGGEKQHEPYYANADLAAAYLEAAFTTLKDETMTTKDPTTPAVVRPAAGANATALDTAAPARSFFDWGRASAFAIAAVSTAD